MFDSIFLLKDPSNPQQLNNEIEMVLFVAAIAGVASHIIHFNRGEHHLYGQYYFQGFFVTFALATALIHVRGQQDLMLAMTNVGRLSLYYLAGLYSSLVVYRLLLNPLNKFPGPLGARLSGFWLSLRFRNCDGYKQVRMLHEKYGFFVRVGPSDLSIAHPKAVELLYGAKSKCTKGTYYDLTKPVVSMQTFRNKSQHDARRRVWSAAFGDNALRGYEKRIRQYRDKFISHLASSDGQPVNITKLINMYSFDVMGDLAFGKPFDMLETSRNHWAIELMNDGIRPLAFMFPMWFFRFMTAIPLLTRDWWRFLGFCSDRLAQRIKETPDIPDIMSVLLAPLKGHQPSKQDLQLLVGDSQLIIGAGSDTTATTMTAIIYELAKHPEETQKLRLELAPLITDRSDFVLHEKIAHLKHLNGIINEALRLYPPVPTAIHRKTPKEGILIDGTHIPGDMNVWCSQYTLGRSDLIYSKPDKFVPERWYQFPEMVKEKTAFAPFSIGPYGCIGRPLAMLNLRTTLAQMVMAFDIGFAPGEDGAGIEKNAVDHFMLSFGELNLSFTKRLQSGLVR